MHEYVGELVFKSLGIVVRGKVALCAPPSSNRVYDAIDYLSAYATAAFLIQTQPQKFLDLLRLLREGKAAEAALERAYGEPVEKLQAKWVRWIRGRR